MRYKIPTATDASPRPRFLSKASSSLLSPFRPSKTFLVLKKLANKLLLVTRNKMKEMVRTGRAC